METRNAPPVTDASEATADPVESAHGEATAAKCPIDHTAFAKVGIGCPVPHGAAADTATRTPAAERSRADVIARKVLRIRERPEGVTNAQAYSAFQKSMFISATRCLLTYIVFPFVLPAVGFATGVGPVLGIAIGSIAIVCDVFAVRRFHAVEHKYRWHFTAVAALVIGLLAYLLVEDWVTLLT
jgi:hypothetical protein